MKQQFEHGYALLVGVDENEVPRLALPDVLRDVEAVESVLRHPERCGYLEQNVKRLTGPDATRAGILGGLAWLQDKVAGDPEATAILFYTGHGAGLPRENPSEFFFIPCDMQESQIELSALRASDVARALERMHPPRLLVILDCCHAAGMEVKGEPNISADLVSSAIDPELFMKGEPCAVAPDAKGLEKLQRGRGRAALSSCLGSQKSYVRRDGAMSVFTYHLIEALTGHAEPREGASEVLVSDITQYVWRHVPETVKADWGGSVEQTPYPLVSGEFPVAMLLGGDGWSKGMTAPDPLEDVRTSLGTGNSVNADKIENSIIVQGSNNKVAGHHSVVAEIINADVSIDNS